MTIDNVYFDGDPEVDSTRRRMERVLKGGEPPRRWPWILAALGSGSVWLLWQLGRSAARDREAAANQSKVEGSRTR
jgi:hypothetical protein